MPIALDLTTVYSMARPLPGLEAYASFRLQLEPEYQPFVFLVAEQDPNIRLTLLDPFLLYPDYRDHLAGARLDGFPGPADQESGEPELAVMVVVARGPEGVGANLAAPILFHEASRQAIQVILDQGELPLFAPLELRPAC